MFSDFFKAFDKKKFLLVTKLIFVFVSLVLIVNIAGRTYTRYESDVDVSANANVAFFVIDQGLYENQIYIDGLEPSSAPKYYRFYVTNKKNNKRADVDLEYTIKFETTTNLPLQYEIIRNQSFEGAHTNIISNTLLRQDDNDVYYKVYNCDDVRTFSHLRDETDEYTLKVVFPLENKNKPDSYQGVIEMFSIIINASQVA
ncbi:MAG: hypothetical protein IJK67_00920 [Bacilli bacterium]|nr:hypothetical protein [Bacilli bacterium]